MLSAWTLFVLASSPVAAPADLPLGELAGGWELVTAPRFDPQGAWPWGIENRRYVFKEDGRWYSLNSDERLSRAQPIGRIERLGANRVKFHTPEGKAPEYPIRLLGEDLHIVHGEHSVWIYRRITDPRSLDRPVELRSLEVLEADPTTAAVSRYGEYLKLSHVRSQVEDTRLHGVWELVRVRGVPIPDRPDQGYYNDVLVIAASHFCFIQRASQNGAVCADVDQRGRGPVQLKDDQGQPATRLQASFTAFGQLELADGAFVQTFTLIGRDPETAPAVPLKIAVYRD